MGVANHRVEVVRINELLRHPNADQLSIVKIAGYQVVVRTEDFRVGDLAYYVPPDSIVPQTEPFRFIWEGHQEEPDGEVREKYRRITVRRFRKEYSEGLLMPMQDAFFGEYIRDGLYGETGYLLNDRFIKEGDDISELLGITHYNPPEEPVSTKGENERAPGKRRFPRSLKGWFFFVLAKLGIRVNGNTYAADREAGLSLPEYDVDAYKHYVGAFLDGEEVIATEKIHGSNARFIYHDGHMYAGSRRLWKSPKSKCIWRQALQNNPWIEEWCRAHEGWALYGEVCPTQVGYDYGCKEGAVKFFVFDIRTPEGEWIPYSELEALYYTHEIEVPPKGADLVHKLNWVPILYRGPFNAARMKELAEGKSTVEGASHLREGVVIRPIQERAIHNLGRLQLKIVGLGFFEKENK